MQIRTRTKNGSTMQLVQRPLAPEESSKDYCPLRPKDHVVRLLAGMPSQSLCADKIMTDILVSRPISEVTSGDKNGSRDTEPSNESFLDLMESLWSDKSASRQEFIRIIPTKTCRWLFKQQEYIDWLDIANQTKHQANRKRILWIRGSPGAGKSTLIKSILSEILKNNNSDTAVVSFFFHARGHRTDRSMLGMLQSLLRQLFMRLPKLQSALDINDIPSPGHQWTVAALKRLLKKSSIASKRLISSVSSTQWTSASQRRAAM